LDENYSINYAEYWAINVRIPKVQSKMNNPEKLAT
jgi:hypothetical protein